MTRPLSQESDYDIGYGPFIFTVMALKAVSFDAPDCPFNTDITSNDIGALPYSIGKYDC